MSYIKTNRTDSEKVQERTERICKKMYIDVQNGLNALNRLSADNGGNAAILALLGDDSQTVRNIVVAAKTFLKTESDMTDDCLKDCGIKAKAK